jgi:hypothetical protein
MSAALNGGAGVDNSIAVPRIGLIPEAVLDVERNLAIEGAREGRQFF